MKNRCDHITPLTKEAEEEMAKKACYICSGWNKICEDCEKITEPHHNVCPECEGTLLEKK